MVHHRDQEQGKKQFLDEMYKNKKRDEICQRGVFSASCYFGQAEDTWKRVILLRFMEVIVQRCWDNHRMSETCICGERI